MVQKRCRLSFGLLSLFLAILLLAVGLAWLRRETNGRLVLHSDTGKIDFRGSSLKVQISSDDSRDELESSVRAALHRHARKYDVPGLEFSVNVMEGENYRVLMCDYDRWVRYRLDLTRCRYVLDYNDPIARARNKELAETIERVTKGPLVFFRR